MKVVLAGGAGFAGRNLIRVMIEEGFEPEDITVLDKNERNMELLQKYRVKEFVADLY
jgi:nucleoside-diphosphate-sugar epimerase